MKAILFRIYRYLWGAPPCCMCVRPVTSLEFRCGTGYACGRACQAEYKAWLDSHTDRELPSIDERD